MKKLVALTLLLTLHCAVNAETFLGFTGVPLIDYTDDDVAVPNCVGQATSAACDTILMAAGLVLGGVTDRCHSEPDNEVVGQSPAPGTLVAAGATVDVLTSTGVACQIGNRPGVRLPGLRFPGF